MDVFISHSDEDRETAVCIAEELEKAGFVTWYYERDCIPGLSYLRQTRQAIDSARVVIILISLTALRSHQIERELVRAHESDKAIIPILNGISFLEFKKTKPDWHQAIGAYVGVVMPTSGVKGIIPRIIAGLIAIGIQVDRASETKTQGTDGPNPGAADASFVCEEQSSASVPDLQQAPATWVDDAQDEAVIPSDSDSDTKTPGGRDSDVARGERTILDATIISEHPLSGFYADVMIPDDLRLESGRLPIRLSHRLLGPVPRHITVQLPNTNADPVLYVRLNGLMMSYPVILRVHWLARMRSYAVPVLTSAKPIQPSVQVRYSIDGLTSQVDAGVVTTQGFRVVLPAGTCLPSVTTIKVMTSREFQKRIVLTPAVRSSDGKVSELGKLRIPVLPTPAGKAWVQFTFRIDPDGRYSISARNPIHGMRVDDLWFQ